MDQKYVGNSIYRLTERLSFNFNGSYQRESDPERDIPQRNFGQYPENNDNTGIVIQSRNNRTRKQLFSGFSYLLDEITSSTIRYGFIKRNFKENGPYDEIDSKLEKLKIMMLV